MNYTVQELTSMIYVIGSCEENCFLASRVYAQRFPERRHPDSRSLENLRERFNRTGSVAYEKQTRTKTVLNEENALAISLAIVENPRISVRDISRDLGIKKSSVSKCIKQNKFHPYHFQLHQELIENDFERRIIFCQWAQNQIAENEDFFKFVLFTDECTFHRNGFVNRHNFHYYDTQNPHVVELDGAPPHFSANVRQHLTENFPGQWIGRQGLL
ncbi:hypothetical protein NQ315_008991 [Exocentrus adspersus]|uniref:DUF4817 domain-containing protein n=1 Tax=Exocentrus adspersus TaxID=1586481 RepID=A0AAV8VET4_9CUCU|nr:hypothetical protein NQ315_008991 [Exocentrus adspersus]